MPEKHFAHVGHHEQPKEIPVLIWHNAACAQNGTINDVQKYHALFFVKNRKRGFAVGVKTEMVRKEYDYIDYTFRRT